MDFRRSPFPPIFYKVVGDNIVKTQYKGDKFAAQKTDIQREIYEESFIESLNKKTTKKISWSQYKKWCTEGNFKKYFAKISTQKKNAIKNQTENVFRQRWEDGHYLGEFNSHRYNVDAVANYLEFQRYFERNEPRPGIIDKESYLSGLAYDLQSICNQRELPYKAMISSGFPLLIPTDDSRFYVHLARKLMMFDVHKIGAVLDWNYAIFKGEGFFPVIVEHGVYDMVKHSSPFDNDIRLEKIMNWVERNRSFTSPDEQQKKTEQEQSEPQFHFWPYTSKSLHELHTALVNEQKIETNTSFVDSFKEHAVLIDNPTVWKGNQTHLIYLFHLIYKGKGEYKGGLYIKSFPGFLSGKIVTEKLNRLRQTV